MKMQKIFLLLISLLFAINASSGIKYSINEAWRFSLNKSKDVYKTDFNDKSWEIVSLPHTWNDKDAIDEEPGYFRGQGWYRKNLFIGDVAKDKVVYLYFEGVNQVAEVYINDKYVGIHKGGYTRFCFDVSSFINVGSDNQISIRVDNSHDEQISPLSADFTFFGGIYRDVYLQIEDPIHFSLLDKASEGVYITTPKVSAENAEVVVKYLVNNTGTKNRKVRLEYSIVAPDGKPVLQFTEKINLKGETLNQQASKSFTINNPKLWSTKKPDRYVLKTTLRDEKSKEVLDESVEKFGLRWFEFDVDKGFFLNGEHLKLMGTCRHQCFEEMGNALDDQLHIRDIELLKNMGGNFLRIAHYPQDPLVLDLCDRLGIITSVEVPIINAITESDEFLENSITMMDEMMKQNFNHPSLVLWTYMNEIMLRPPYKIGSDEYKAYCKEVNRQASAIEAHIRELDPYRYTQIPFHAGFKRYEDSGLNKIPMTIGLNLYSGWYSEGIEKLESWILNFRKKNPDKPLTISEYGADVDVRIHSEKPERFDFSVEFGDMFHEHYLKVFLKHDFITGTNIWNLNDFHSEIRTDAVPRINSKGITGLDRTPKNTYYLYKANLSDQPFVKIASSDWKYRAASLKNDSSTYEQEVKIYSNQKNVDLYHNGTFRGKLSVVDGIAKTKVAFTDGTNYLRADINDGKIIDIAEINYILIPQVFRDDFTELNVLLGANRSFEDKIYKTAWIPEQEYRVGSWGYIGGNPFRAKTSFGSLPAADLDVLGTDKDPIFQTQRMDIEAFKADVPDGRYYVYLYWADFNREESKEIVAYNLGNDRIYENIQPRIFDVAINNLKVSDKYDIPNEAGTGRAVVKKFEINTSNREGITIKFTPIEGSVILNAVRIVRVD